MVFNDLKPDNIMVDRNSGHVTLIDFGFATTYINPDGSHVSSDDVTE